MNLRDLEYVAAVLHKRHFGLAAEMCGVSQPALSAQIRKLEEELGLRLFERTSRGVLPCAEAQFVFDAARDILDRAESLRRQARLQREGRQAKVLRLGVIPTVAPYYLPDFFARISGKSRSAAQIHWQIREEKTADILAALREGQLDGAILSLPAQLPEGMRSQKILDEPFYLAVPAGHALAKHASVKAEQMEAGDMLLLDEGHCLKDQVIGLCASGLESAVQSFRATSLETLRHMVATGSGATLMPAMARRKDDGIAYVPFASGRFMRRLALVWRAQGRHAEDFQKIARLIARGGS
jgi:LysR family hydrogen peroxide-inducible transcriptional activator